MYNIYKNQLKLEKAMERCKSQNKYAAVKLLTLTCLKIYICFDKSKAENLSL